MKPSTTTLFIVLLIIPLLGYFPNFISCKPCGDLSNKVISNLGINYGMVADNLPPPSKVAKMIDSISIKKVKIYNPNATVLMAFANTGISFIVGVGNENLQSLKMLENAKEWVQQNIVPYFPRTLISSIAVGNEVLTRSSNNSDNTNLMVCLLPAMRNLYSALNDLELATHISISTPHSLAILSSSYPPSSSTFDTSIATIYIKPLLSFLSQTKSPFMVNIYPFFAYKTNPATISLQYVLFKDIEGVKDSNNGIIYHNMLEAQVDAVYAAMQALGFDDIRVMVTETGWPSAGEPEEPGANLKNAQEYNSKLISRLASKKGTPMKPNIPLEAYIFALFNEDAKPGPTSERNYGIFKPNGEKVYYVGLDKLHSQVPPCINHGLPSVSSAFTSSSHKTTTLHKIQIYTLILKMIVAFLLMGLYGKV